MPQSHRVANARGAFAIFNDDARELERWAWIPENHVTGWKRAAASGAKTCARISELCDELGWAGQASMAVFGLSNEQEAELAGLMVGARELFDEELRRVHLHRRQLDQRWADGGAEKARARLAAEAFGAKARETRWVAFPGLRWTSELGEASEMDAASAEQCAKACAAAFELASLMKAATAEAKALGALPRKPAPGWPAPVKFDAMLCEGAAPAAFDAADSCSQGKLHAVYFGRSGKSGAEGYLTDKWELSASLGSARMFRFEEDAEVGASLARDRMPGAGPAAIVELSIELSGYAPAEASRRGAMSRLDEALARAEAEHLGREAMAARLAKLETELATRLRGPPRRVARI